MAFDSCNRLGRAKTRILRIGDAGVDVAKICDVAMFSVEIQASSVKLNRRVFMEVELMGVGILPTVMIDSQAAASLALSREVLPQ